MLKKTIHILFITVLAFNFMGAWALAMPTDCGMECCQASELATAGVPVIEYPGCCSTSETTCTFQAGDYQEIFDKALCCHNGGHSAYGMAAAAGLPTGHTEPSLGASCAAWNDTGPPSAIPLYLNNASLLC